MNRDFLKLVSERTVLFDGAMGSMLIDSGLKPHECPELWNVEKSSIIQEIHRRYFAAGADVVLTNTFGGTEIKLGTKGLEKRADDLNKAAVRNARSVCKTNRYIAGDIGPTGKFLPPVGDISEGQLYQSFSRQTQVLLQEGVDIIVIETMYDLREALQAVKAVRDITSSIPLITTMTFEKKKRGFFTLMGDTPEKCFSSLESSGVNIVGANCTLEGKDMVELCKLVCEKRPLPLIFQPNAGQPAVRDAKVTYAQTPKEFAADIDQLVEMGASIVGGCCGTTPEFINAASEALRKRR